MENFDTLIKEAKEKYRQRNSILTKRCLFISLILVITLLGIVYLSSTYNLTQEKTTWIIAADFAVFICIYLFAIIFVIKKYNAVYKKNCISKIITSIIPNGTFNAEDYIAEEKLFSLEKFIGKWNYTYGQNYISGKTDNRKLEFSDFNLKVVCYTHKGTKSSRSIFKGFVLCITFNNIKFMGETAIKKNGFNPEDLRLRNLFAEEDKAYKKYAPTDNTDFYKYFSVMSTNSEETKKLLTDSFKEKIISLFEKRRKSIYIHTYENNLFLAARDKNKHFKGNSPESDIAFIKELYNLFVC